MRPAIERRAEGGVTLIEMIVAIVIMGILVALVGMFGRRQIDAYLDVASRAALADAADTALRRISRDLQGALPNSVRATTAGGSSFLEFVPIVDAGRYRAGQTPTGAGNPLDFADPADNSFDVLGPTVTVPAGGELVIYNLGQPGSDVYDGSSRRALTTTGGGLASLGYSGGQFPFASPQSRFQIVGAPATYECDPAAGVLRRRWCYAYQSGQPVAFGGLGAHPSCTGVGSAVLVDNVSACSITYVPGALQRNGLVSINLTLTANNESVTLMQQVDILNAP